VTGPKPVDVEWAEAKSIVGRREGGGVCSDSFIFKVIE